jgi:hypothetical protein
MVEWLPLFDKVKVKDPLHNNQYPNNDVLKSSDYKLVHIVSKDCCINQEMILQLSSSVTLYSR